MAFDLLNPQISKVTKSLDNVVITTYGLGGLGKTPVAVDKAFKPLYLAFGKSGLSGLNNVPFFSINSWSEFKQVSKEICNKKKYEEYRKMYQTIVLDEMEVLWSYLVTYVCQINGVTKVKEANNGYGAWNDLKEEWETEMLRLQGSGFCIHYILHTAPDENGKMFPVGDVKRMLPILLNHSEIIGYVSGNGIHPETGKPIHSSLMLAGTEEYFARTRNEYFDPVIEDYTAENLINAYYDALDRQAKEEGITPATKEETAAAYASEEIDFEALMNEVSEYGSKLAELKGMDVLTDIVESTLGKGAKVSSATPKQAQAIQVILMDIKEALDE